MTIEYNEEAVKQFVKQWNEKFHSGTGNKVVYLPPDSPLYEIEDGAVARLYMSAMAIRDDVLGSEPSLNREKEVSRKTTKALKELGYDAVTRHGIFSDAYTVVGHWWTVVRIAGRKPLIVDLTMNQFNMPSHNVYPFIYVSEDDSHHREPDWKNKYPNSSKDWAS